MLILVEMVDHWSGFRNWCWWPRVETGLCHCSRLSTLPFHTETSSTLADSLPVIPSQHSLLCWLLFSRLTSAGLQYCLREVTWTSALQTRSYWDTSSFQTLPLSLTQTLLEVMQQMKLCKKESFKGWYQVKGIFLEHPNLKLEHKDILCIFYEEKQNCQDDHSPYSKAK